MDEQPDKKKLIPAPIIGEKGVAVAKLLTLEMGSTWHPTNPLLESGIDAKIELRDPETGIMLNRWVSAQSRAHEGPFKREDETSFVFSCKRRDLQYWADGSNVTILIVSRPDDREAWWRPISADMAEGEGATVDIAFDKYRDKYGRGCFEALRELAEKKMAPVGEMPDSTNPTTEVKPGGSIRVHFSAIDSHHLVPAIPVTLLDDRGEPVVQVRALIDSGANSSCFPYAFAELLGIHLYSESLESVIQTASGSSSIYVCPKDIEVTIFGQKIRLKAAFGPVPIAILGRKDFFSQFSVTIDEPNQSFTLKRYEDVQLPRAGEKEPE
jgi:hypothetical protein